MKIRNAHEFYDTVDSLRLDPSTQYFGYSSTERKFVVSRNWNSDEAIAKLEFCNSFVAELLDALPKIKGANIIFGRDYDPNRFYYEIDLLVMFYRRYAVTHSELLDIAGRPVHPDDTPDFSLRSSIIALAHRYMDDTKELADKTANDARNVFDDFQFTMVDVSNTLGPDAMRKIWKLI